VKHFDAFNFVGYNWPVWRADSSLWGSSGATPWS